jgi:hypothetical protein
MGCIIPVFVKREESKAGDGLTPLTQILSDRTPVPVHEWVGISKAITDPIQIRTSRRLVIRTLGKQNWVPGRIFMIQKF